MGDINLEVYLYFKGQCREAMEFYRDTFGGKLTMQTYGEVPGMSQDDSKKDWLMHAALQGGDVKLMASDTDKASPVAAKIDLSLGGSDEVKLRRIFGKLSAGGNINSPPHKEFWGDTFGSVTDKFGVTWMIVISAPRGNE